MTLNIRVPPVSIIQGVHGDYPVGFISFVFVIQPIKVWSSVNLAN